MQVPDPNGFGGAVKVAKAGEREWTEVPLAHPYAENSRGVGVADMAMSILSGNTRPHRASGELTYHVLDIMHAIHDASLENRHIELESKAARPAAMPIGLADGEIDA